MLKDALIKKNGSHNYNFSCTSQIICWSMIGGALLMFGKVLIFFNLGVKRQQTNNSQKDSYSIITFISPKILETIKSTKKARSLGH